MGRRDGKKLKHTDGMTRIGALMMGKTRVDCQNHYTHEVNTRSIDEYIAMKKKDGVDYTYRDIVIATFVRIFHLRPGFNRFVIAGTFYQRNYIDVAFMVHKNLRTGEKETLVKCRFTGKETLAEIKQQIDDKIDKAINGTNETDNFADKLLGSMPTWFLRMFMGILRGLDRLGWLSDKFMFETSPFHCSFLISDLKSLHLGPTWHHMYNFGNCGFMACMGKEQLKAVVDKNTEEVHVEKIMELGITEDDRVTDGLIFSHMIRTAGRILDNLSVLERAPEDDEVKWPAPTMYEMKKKAKAAKKKMI